MHLNTLLISLTLLTTLTLSSPIPQFIDDASGASGFGGAVKGATDLAGDALGGSPNDIVGDALGGSPIDVVGDTLGGAANLAGTLAGGALGAGNGLLEGGGDPVLSRAADLADGVIADGVGEVLGGFGDGIGDGLGDTLDGLADGALSFADGLADGVTESVGDGLGGGSGDGLAGGVFVR